MSRSTDPSGPSAARLSELLSPTATRQSLAQRTQADQDLHPDQIDFKRAKTQPDADHVKPYSKTLDRDEANELLVNSHHPASSAGPSHVDAAPLDPSQGQMILGLQNQSAEQSLRRPAVFQLPVAVFNGAFPPGQQIKEPVYQRPIAMTSFSYVPGRQLMSGLRRYESLKPINLGFNCIGFNLHTGIESAVYRDEAIDEGLDGLLQW